jgi:hypothetical protein
LGDGRLQRKATKTKRNELKFAFGFGNDGKKEEKVVKELQLLAEVSEPTKVVPPCLLEPVVRSQSAAADGNDDIDDCHRLVVQKRQSPVGLHRGEGERRTRVLRNHLQREAVINAWQDEQSKVTPSLSHYRNH